MLALDAFPKKLDEIVILSSIAGLQQMDQSKALDFHSVSGFHASSASKCRLNLSPSTHSASGAASGLGVP